MLLGHLKLHKVTSRAFVPFLWLISLVNDAYFFYLLKNDLLGLAEFLINFVGSMFTF